MQVATRTGYCQIGNPIRIASNFFRFQNESSKVIKKFAIQLTPDIPAQDYKARERVVFRARQDIVAQVGQFVVANTVLFASVSNSVQDGGEFNFTSTVGTQEYAINLRDVGICESEVERRMFYNKFFNVVQGRLKLTMINRKFFNEHQKVDLNQHNLSIWPGFATSIANYEGGCLLQIDTCSRVIRTNPITDQLRQLQQKEGQNFRRAADKLLVGANVMTAYNKRTYQITAIEWDKNPQSTFTNQNEEEISFQQYYQTRWNISIQDTSQPLLKSKVKDMEIMLIPELCRQSGLTDEIRSNFNIMKEMATVTKKEPNDRILLCSDYVNTIKQDPRASQDVTSWGVDILTQPVELQGHVLPAGGIMMDEGRKNFNINGNTGSFDREVQQAMYDAPRLDMWGVFYMQSDQRLIDQFKTHLQQAIQQFKVPCQPPNFFAVSSNRWNDWNEQLRQKLNPNVKLIVCVLPGQRGKSPIYDDLKRLTFSQFPVPTQCILNATLKKDRGLRSVVNKVLVQINAKVGGTPWALQNLPFQNDRTMVVGIDVFHKLGKYSVVGFCATVDPVLSKYVPITLVNRESQEMSETFGQAMFKAVEQFKSSNNGELPRRIIVFRDGVSDSQRKVVLQQEVPQLVDGYMRHGADSPPQMAVIIINKRVNARFFHAQDNNTFSNPPLGTCIDREVIEKDGYDFYVLPAKANQGAMTPTHFHIIHDTSGASVDELASLTYRLCYAYYNWSGSIRVPAPCQYAHKLAYTYGDRATADGPPNPHDAWVTSSRRSLYFL